MASDNKYAYYFRGRDIAIVENKDGKWQSPTETVAEGLMFEYSKLPNVPTVESSDLDMSDTLANAIIYYFKAMKAEEEKELQEKEYYYALFLKWAHMDRDNRIKTVRRITPLFSSAPNIRNTK
tara:strand:+ start:502 stop:870 length:369 start_codon:yes stop_codon:yes gene_type:complete